MIPKPWTVARGGCYSSAMTEDTRALVAELCRQFYHLGWCTGTGGGISIREGDRIYVAPSGVQKERIRPEHVFVLDLEERVVERPDDPALRVSECLPLFYNAYRTRHAGAVIHSHSRHAVLATLLWPRGFRVRHLEMVKGLTNKTWHDEVCVPVVENTARECDLTDRMAEAMRSHPDVDAVLVKRHGVYIWGPTWQEAKTQAEVYDWLFAMAADMHRHGLDPAADGEGES